MINRHKTNGEAICFICNKSEIDDKDIILSDYLDIIKRKLHIVKNTKLNMLSQSKIENPKELKQICKCEKYAHNKCIIQYMFSFLELKCDDCGDVYNIDMSKILSNDNSIKSHYNDNTCYLIFTILFLIIFLAAAICFYSLNFIPSKYDYWNYVIGTICIVICVLFALIIYIMTKKKNGTQHNDSIFNKYLDCSTNELIEEKFNINLFLKSTISKEKELGELYKKYNNGDSKEIPKEVDLEEKFHNHQIIKSTLIINDQVTHKIAEITKEKKQKVFLPKSKTKANMTSKTQEEMILKDNQIINTRKKSLRDLSKTPMITIKETKEILEDFSPVNKKEDVNDSDAKMKKVSTTHNLKQEENKAVIHSTDVKKNVS